VNGNCLGGYYGTTSRSCIQSGSNGNWDSISGSCNGIFIFIVFLLIILFHFIIYLFILFTHFTLNL